jgi:hypothetical protein
VRFLLDAEVIARLGETRINPGGATVDDHEVRTVAGEEAVDHLHREIRGAPVAIARYENWYAFDSRWDDSSIDPRSGYGAGRSDLSA